jgi:hypothetical protein
MKRKDSQSVFRVSAFQFTAIKTLYLTAKTIKLAGITTKIINQKPANPIS